jgi:hypothetical protein
MALRRARGAILRLARRRPLGLIVGAGMLTPALWLRIDGPGFWWTDALSLLLGATGAALVWAALTGPTPDWTQSRD